MGAEAAAEGTTVSIHVETFNPAKRLYQRVGFVDAGVEAAAGPYRRIDWDRRGPVIAARGRIRPVLTLFPPGLPHRCQADKWSL